jgi:hypothetical protein
VLVNDSLLMLIIGVVAVTVGGGMYVWMLRHQDDVY